MAEMKFYPLLLVKPKTMTRADIRRAEKLGGICVVECSEPETSRFVEPPALIGGDVLAHAAITLTRFIMSQPSPMKFDRNEIAKWFVDLLLKGHQPGTTTQVQAVQPVKK